jgi:S1-C subfamily serine protease
MNGQNINELFENYLNGKLNDQELHEFQVKLKDPIFRESFEEFKELHEKLNFYSRRKRLKDRMNEYHSELEKKDRRENVIRLNTYKFIAVAATTGVLFFLTTSFIIDYYFSSKKEVSSKYQELSREVKRIEAEQNALKKNLEPEDAEKEITLLSGTGFLISSNGYILTTYHLVKNSHSVLIQNAHVGVLKAEKIFASYEYDLALLKIEGDSIKKLGKIPFTFRNSKAEPGEIVFSLGYPREEMVYGEGSVSSNTGYLGDTLSYQISVPVNPGNSGGPLLDESGNLTGIIRGKNRAEEGTGFAVKTATINKFLKASGEKISLPKNNSLDKLKRKDQVKKLKPFVFQVKVY